MRAENPGWSSAQIARELGVTSSAVRKALNPERAQEYNRRAEAKPGRHQAKLAWNRSEKARGRCGRCGGLKGISAEVSGHRLCRPCEFLNRTEIHETRLSIVEGMWAEGWLTREISEVLGYATKQGASPYLDELRKAGRIGYRYVACAERAAA